MGKFRLGMRLFSELICGSTRNLMCTFGEVRVCLLFTYAMYVYMGMHVNYWGRLDIH